MREKKFYQPPTKTTPKISMSRLFRMLFVVGVMLFSMPAMAQMYYNVTTLSGTETLGDVDVTVTSTGSVNSFICTGPAVPYWTGAGASGSYIYTFSHPVSSIVVSVDVLDAGDDVTININGVPYAITSANIEPLPTACFSSSYTAEALGGNLVASVLGSSSATLRIQTGTGINSVEIFSAGGAGGILNGFSFSRPVFNNGTSQSISVCQDLTSDFSSFLTVNDASVGATMTWTVSSAPSHGSISVGGTETTDGISVTPSGFTYTPTTGYVGADQFTIVANNGIGGVDTSVIDVTVNPTPTVANPGSQAVCHGSSTTDILFTGTPGTVTYSWTNDNTSIGLANSGTTDILSFTGTNTTAIPQVATVMVTPHANGCDGTVQTFSVTVNPIPDVANPGDQSVCNNSMTAAIDFTGAVSGTNYTWTNDNSSIGLATSGTGNIAAFTATNSGTTAISGVVTVTPEFATCVGASQTFTITVLPTPVLTTVANQAHCEGQMTDEVVFTATMPSTYTWVNDNPTVGLGASGAGDTIHSFAGLNATAFNNTAIIKVTPTSGLCAGPVDSFRIVVKPTPRLSSTLTPDSVCDNSLFTYILTSATTGVTYSWNRDAVSGIANPAGAGVDTIRENLDNTTAAPIVVTYVDTLTANGCTNVEYVHVTVEPTPELSSVAPIPFCNNTPFTYEPLSGTTGTIFSWVRDSISGISNRSRVGTGIVSDTLNNTTDSQVHVNYVYTLYANGCLNSQTVVATVNPTPMLSSTTTPASVCDSVRFFYVPTSGTTGTTYSWTRAAVTGITNPAGSGIDTVSDTLVNITNAPIAVTYHYTLTAHSCSHEQDVTVTVNPKPRLATTTTPPAVCDSALFHYVPVSSSIGATSTWSRAAITGIANAAASGVDSISEYLHNTTVNPIDVVYLDTLSINGCTNIERITVTVNPKPTLTSSLSPAALCDSAIFNYPPTSGTTGTSFAWDRPYVFGILLTPGTGTGNPNEQMINTTNVNVTVNYVYTLTANSCVNTQTVSVLVHPTPTLSSALSKSVCSGAPFVYTATSNTPGVKYQWSRAAVAGITPATKSDTTTILNDTLTSSSISPVLVPYLYTLNIGGCTHKEILNLTVNPAPSAPAIAITSPSSLCSKTMFQNFGAATAPAAGTTYTWSASNAFVWATGSTRQYCLVNFNDPGNASVTLTASSTTNCTSKATFNVSVGTTESSRPEVIYYRGQFMCLQNDVDSYQWGYDDASTLDSTLIPGEVNQNYFLDVPTTEYRNYWVITKKGDCIQKSYYNTPLGVTPVNNGEATSMKLYPNPATEMINVEINGTVNGNVTVDVINLMGQKLTSAAVNNHTATINVAQLPAGVYLVDCYRDGVKLATSRFIKN